MSQPVLRLAVNNDAEISRGPESAPRASRLLSWRASMLVWAGAALAGWALIALLFSLI